MAFCLAFPVAPFLESDIRFVTERLPRGPEGVFDLRHASGARLIAVLVERAQSEADSADLVPIGLRGDPGARTQLLLEAVDAAQQLAITGSRSVLHVALQHGLDEVQRLLCERGFEVAFRMHWMETRDAFYRVVTPPSGLRFEDWGPDISVESVDDLVAAAFQGTPGFMRTSVEDLRRRLTEARPAPRMLLEGNKLVGLVRLRAPSEDGVGVLSLVARDPAWRGRRLGDCLLSEAMRSLVQAGSSRFALEVVTHNARALALYERHGFSSVSTETTLRRPLSRR